MAEAGAPRRRTRVRKWVWLALAVVAVGAFAYWWTMQRRLDAMRDDLVARSYTLLGGASERTRTIERPVDGTVLDRVVAVYPTLAMELAAWDSQEEPVYLRCAYVRDGMWPLTDLPATCRELLERLDPELDALQAAARAESVGEAAAWLELPWWPVARAVSAVALRARIELVEDDDPEAALGSCVAMLELWRDLSRVTALQTGSAAAVIVRRMTDVCGAAVMASSAGARQRFATRLEVILTEASPMAEAVRREALLGELTIFAPQLPEGIPQQMHPAAVARAEGSLLSGVVEGHEPGWLAPLVLVSSWRAYVDVMAAIAEHVDTPPEQASPAIEALLSDPALPGLAHTAATARWRYHVEVQFSARDRIRRLVRYARGSSE